MNLKNEERHRKVKAALCLKGVTQQQIANELGITLEAVNQVVTGRRNIYRVINALVAAGVPKRYFPDARRTRKADSTNKEV